MRADSVEDPGREWDTGHLSLALPRAELAVAGRRYNALHVHVLPLMSVMQEHPRVCQTTNFSFLFEYLEAKICFTWLHIGLHSVIISIAL